MNPQLPTTHVQQPDSLGRHTDRDQLDRILLDDTLVPSSGFAASVMDSIAAITAQAAAPAPIPFPWKLAIPGCAAFLIALIAAIRLLMQIRQSNATFEIPLTWLVNQPIAAQTTQAVLAVAAALLCLLLTRYLAPGRSTR